MSLEDELIALTDGDGFIKPRAVVDWARENPTSEIYKHLEWDDAKAAAAHRLDQARRLIAIHVRQEDGTRGTISLVQDRGPDGGYRHLGPVLSNRELRVMALRQALRELRRLEARYRHLTELSRVFEAANGLTAEIDAVSGDAAA
jgi:hypothetical protein